MHTRTLESLSRHALLLTLTALLVETPAMAAPVEPPAVTAQISPPPPSAASLAGSVASRELLQMNLRSVEGQLEDARNGERFFGALTAVGTAPLAILIGVAAPVTALGLAFGDPLFGFAVLGGVASSGLMLGVIGVGLVVAVVGLVGVVAAELALAPLMHERQALRHQLERLDAAGPLPAAESLGPVGAPVTLARF